MRSVNDICADLAVVVDCDAAFQARVQRVKDGERMPLINDSESRTRRDAVERLAKDVPDLLAQIVSPELPPDNSWIKFEDMRGRERNDE